MFRGMFGRRAGGAVRKGFLAATVLTPVVGLGGTAMAGEVTCAEPGHFHFAFEQWNKGYDVAALRRGYQVYKEVCSACHSMRYMHYRDFVGVFMTTAQAKAEAKNAMIADGPDDNGEMFQRPGSLQDVLPAPYPNSAAAKAANNGAEPPDLSLIAGAREGEANYIFQLLTGYRDDYPDTVRDALGKGQAFNPFMDGGMISMPPPIGDGHVEYPDGTPATVTQMARDVTEFLHWSLNRNWELQKQTAFMACVWLSVGSGLLFWARRYWLVQHYAQRTTWKQTPPIM